LSTLRPKETVDIQVVEGQVIYATRINDWKSIDSIEVKAYDSEYTLGQEDAKKMHTNTYKRIGKTKNKRIPRSPNVFHSPSLKTIMGPKSSLIGRYKNASIKLRDAIMPKLTSILSSKNGSNLLIPYSLISGYKSDGAIDHIGLDHSHHNLIMHTAFIQAHMNESVVLLHMRSYSVAAQFRSIYPRPVKMYFGDCHHGVMQGFLKTGMETTLNGYVGHRFCFTAEDRDKNEVEVASFTLSKDKVLYVVRPTEPEDFALVPPELLDVDRKQMEFADAYLNRTGILWRHFFDKMGPRAPPKLYMWEAKFLGQIHSVVSSEGYWTCKGSAWLCQNKATVALKLEVISTAPKAFLIADFLNDYEAQEIINIALPRIHKSTIGNGDEAGGKSSYIYLSHKRIIA
jgi:hypothetical protein